VDEDHRQRAYALQFWAINLGCSIASITAGVLVHRGYGLRFVLDAATTFAFGMVALRFVGETRPESDGPRARAADPLWLLRSDRLLLVATVLVLVYAVAYAQAGVTLPLAIKDAGLSAGSYGFAIAINGVVIVIGQPLSLSLLERWPRRRTLPIGIALVGAGFATTGLYDWSWQFGLTVVVWSIGEIATAGSFQALVAAPAPEHMRGRCAVGLACGACGMLGHLLGASAYSLSPAMLWLGCLIAGVLSAFGQRWLLSALENRPRSNVEAQRA
jgi:MFS family permease